MTADLGEQFVTALAAKDRDALRGLLDPAIDFRALTPGRCWEATTVDDVVDDVILGHWFEPGDRITGVARVETDEVGSRHRVGYRLEVTNGDGAHVVEQQAYYESDGPHITWLRILCAGYQPIATS
jgi:hypothetical protein